MKSYELFLALTPNFDEASANRFIKDFETFLNKAEIKLEKSTLKGKKPLPYEIKDQKSCFQVFLEVSADSQAVNAVRNKIRLMDDILRYEFFSLAAK